MATNGRMVYRDGDTWVNKRNGAERAASRHSTQREAAEAAADMLSRAGGGELTIKGLNGRIRSKDTVPPGHDPHPPKDKEH